MGQPGLEVNPPTEREPMSDTLLIGLLIGFLLAWLLVATGVLPA